MGENAPSMFFVASFTMPPEFASELNSRSNLYGAIDELGFGESWLSRFSSEPPRASRFDLWCTDRFFFAQSGQSQGNSLASVEICEERVYDNKMRGDLDYTGFRLSLTLGEEAFRQFLKYVGSLASPEDWRSSMFAVRMPSKPFKFPYLRGNPDPWSPGDRYVETLKVIKRLKVDELAVATVEYKPPTDIGRPDRLFMSATTFYRRGNFLWFAIELAS